MASERELKFRVEDLDDLRSRLLELDSERISKSTFEDNWIFDRGEELRARDSLLRLRIDGNGALLTFKGPATFDDGLKIRDEFETRVGDAEATHALLESLGYRVITRYQKRREEWRLGGISVLLDNTPMGDFVEFEGDGARKVAERCGFDAGEAEQRNYLELYGDYRLENPEAPEEMILP